MGITKKELQDIEIFHKKMLKQTSEGKKGLKKL